MSKVVNFIAGFCIAFFIVGCCHVASERQIQPIIKTKTDTLAYKQVVKLQIGIPAAGSEVVATGFAIDKETIATVAHFCVPIVEGPMLGLWGDLEMVSLNNNGELVVSAGLEIVAIDEKNDLCLLKKERHGIVPNKIIEDYESLEVGDYVRVVGGPHGFFPVDTEGKIIQKHINLGPDNLLDQRLLMSAPCTGGNSGSPVFDDKGQVIGVVTNKGDYIHLIVATTATALKEFIKANE